MKKQFRIALIMQGGRGWTGGIEYIKNIIFAMSSLSAETRKNIELCLIISKTADSDLIQSVKPHLNKIYYIEDVIPSNIVYRIGTRAVKLLLGIHDIRYDIFFKRQQFDFVYPYNLSTKFGFKNTAAWIPDFQHKFLPQYFSEQEIKARDASFDMIARTAYKLVFSSHTAENDFYTFFPSAKVNTHVLSFKTIAHENWFLPDPVDSQHKYNLPDKFFIVSNQLWQHKNHLTIFKAMKLLQDSGIKPVVVCTGHIYDYRKPEYSDSILHTIHTFGLSQQVFLLGLIPKADQIQLLRRSIALIQPSLFEGWSSVVEDARCLGKPTILSDISVHEEQNPPNCCFFERESPDALAQVMEQYWQSLRPGPDINLEVKARDRNSVDVQEFGNKFLQIATA